MTAITPAAVESHGRGHPQRDAKLQAQDHWNRTPCGVGKYTDDFEEGSLAFFEAIRQSRYQDTDRWMLEAIPFQLGAGRSVLEIGHGVGTDLVTWAKAGARVTGVDISQRHHDLAVQNVRLHGVAASLTLCDAAVLNFSDSSFDIVYAHGVLHHTADIVRCIGEARRVLKPGGKLVVTLYHTWSLALALHLLRRGILGGALWSKGYRGVLAMMERGADGDSFKPLVKTYGRSGVRAMLGDFADPHVRLAHVGPRPLRWADRVLGPLFGWYIVATATKPG